MFYLTHNISAISSGLQLLVSNLESGCDTALVSMTKVAKTISIIDNYITMSYCAGFLAKHRGGWRSE